MKPFFKGILSLALSGALLLTSVDAGILAADVSETDVVEALNTIPESTEEETPETPESPENLGGGGLCLGRNDRI